jgi:hypothetical protein
VRLFDAALRRLEPFPDPYCGLERGAAVAAAGRHRHWAADLVERQSERPLDADAFPKLNLAGECQVPSSLSDEW